VVLRGSQPQKQASGTWKDNVSDWWGHPGQKKYPVFWYFKIEKFEFSLDFKKQKICN
jgi:hypothetical protein